MNIDLLDIQVFRTIEDLQLLEELTQTDSGKAAAEEQNIIMFEKAVASVVRNYIQLFGCPPVISNDTYFTVGDRDPFIITLLSYNLENADAPKMSVGISFD